MGGHTGTPGLVWTTGATKAGRDLTSKRLVETGAVAVNEGRVNTLVVDTLRYERLVVSNFHSKETCHNLIIIEMVYII